MAAFQQERPLRMELGGLNHEATLACMDHLASALRLAGHFEDAVPLSEQTLQLRKAILGEDTPRRGKAMKNLCSRLWVGVP